MRSIILAAVYHAGTNLCLPIKSVPNSLQFHTLLSMHDYEVSSLAKWNSQISRRKQEMFTNVVAVATRVKQKLEL